MLFYMSSNNDIYIQDGKNMSRFSEHVTYDFLAAYCADPITITIIKIRADTMHDTYSIFRNL
jgi:hypothetical protein